MITFKNITKDSSVSGDGEVEKDSEVQVITFRRPPGLKEISNITLKMFWFEGISFVISHANNQLWISDNLWTENENSEIVSREGLDIALSTTQLIESYEKMLENFLEEEWNPVWCEEENRKQGKEIFQQVFSGCDEIILKTLMKTLTDLVAENEEPRMEEKSRAIDRLDRHLENSIESRDPASMFFMEKIPAKLLADGNSTWRDVSMYLIRCTMDAITEILPLSEPKNSALV